MYTLAEVEDGADEPGGAGGMMWRTSTLVVTLCSIFGRN